MSRSTSNSDGKLCLFERQIQKHGADHIVAHPSSASCFCLCVSQFKQADKDAGGSRAAGLYGVVFVVSHACPAVVPTDQFPEKHPSSPITRERFGGENCGLS